MIGYFNFGYYNKGRLVNIFKCRFRCMPNGVSHVEVILRLGPEASSDSIQSLQISIKENGGELELSNGASAKLISVETLKPGKHLAQCMHISAVSIKFNM